MIGYILTAITSLFIGARLAKLDAAEAEREKEREHYRRFPDSD